MKNKYLLSFLSLFLIISTGCGLNTNSPPQIAAVGGLGGAALGAGTGALVGHLLTNGDVAASALLGAGIGLPVGAAIGYYYTSYTNARELERYDEQIEANKNKILSTDAEIDLERRQAIDESFVVKPDKAYREDLSHGPSLGDPRL